MIIIADVYWVLEKSSSSFLAPWPRSAVANLGTVNFTELAATQLYSLSYGSQRIDHALAEGDVFAVRTSGGNYAKAVVKGLPNRGQNGGLALDWVTYAPSQSQEAKIVSSGSTQIFSGCVFSFDTGAFGDVWWNQEDFAKRRLEPVCRARITNLGFADFSNLTLAELQKLAYGDYHANAIDGSDGKNVLVPGDVFAVHTNGGNYSKAVITAELDPKLNHRLVLKWVTYPSK